MIAQIGKKFKIVPVREDTFLYSNDLINSINNYVKLKELDDQKECLESICQGLNFFRLCVDVAVDEEFFKSCKYYHKGIEIDVYGILAGNY